MIVKKNNPKDEPEHRQGPRDIENWIDFSYLENEDEHIIFENRRRRPDWVARGIMIVTVLGWLCAIVSIVLLELARPAGENLFAGLFEVTNVSQWDITMLIWAYSAIMLSLATSALGLVFNTTRLRRKSDRYNKLLIILCGVSALLVILFLVNYSMYL